MAATAVLGDSDDDWGTVWDGDSSLPPSEATEHDWLNGVAAGHAEDFEALSETSVGEDDDWATAHAMLAEVSVVGRDSIDGCDSGGELQLGGLGENPLTPEERAAWEQLSSSRPGRNLQGETGRKPTTEEIEERRSHAKRRDEFISKLAVHKRMYLKAKERAGKAGARRRKAGREADRQHQLAQEQRRHEQLLYEEEGGEGEMEAVLGVPDPLRCHIPSGGQGRGEGVSEGAGADGTCHGTSDGADIVANSIKDAVTLVQRPLQVEKPVQSLKYLCVLDLETTCEDYSRSGRHLSPQEIIELPTLIIDTTTGEIIAEPFHMFVKPTLHPVLTEFCKDLTGISQEEVDASGSAMDAFAANAEWLRSLGLDPELRQGPPWAFVTVGDFDLRRCVFEDPNVETEKLPAGYRQWVNTKQTFMQFYGLRKRPRHLREMVSALALDGNKSNGSEGGSTWHHGNSSGNTSQTPPPAILASSSLPSESSKCAGLIDTRELARVIKCLVEDGCVFEITSRSFTQPR